MISKIDFNKLVVFDSETTSFSPNYIISLAYMAFYKGKLIKKGYEVFNPDYEIDEESSKVHGFTNEMVKDKPKFYKQWLMKDQIEQYFSNAIWIGHNEIFDERAIQTESKRYKFDMPNHMNCCTLKNAKMLIDKSKIKDYKLTTLCDYFGIKFQGEAHNAFWDTLACAKVYNKLLELGNGELLITVPKD